ncbi:MAG: DNA circularization N-terminal domain-containing protein [Aquincola sp.]|nr:DNA circularization N-terminal domain-containing protein [Aquincola sp.]
MAWSQTLLEASYKGIAFDVEGVQDGERRAVAVYEYPYRDGADVEDLGREARQIRMAAVLFNAAAAGGQDDYEARLEVLLAALRSAEPGELVHPVLGVLPRAIAVDWQVEHQPDLRDGCRLQMVFLEAAAVQRVFDAPSPVLQAERLGLVADKARSAADASLVERVEAVRGGPALRVLALKASINAAMARLRRLTDTTALKVLLSDLDPIFYPRAYVADVRAVLDRALQGLPFGGRNLLFQGSSTTAAGSGLADFKRTAAALAPAKTALVAPDADGLVVQAHAQVHAACTLCDAAGIVLAAELETPLLERADVEQLANTTREAIQAALLSSRAAGGDSAAVGAALRALAYEVQAAAVAVVELRPPVVQRSVPVTGPLRLVAHALYGDHTRAAELQRLNGFGRTLTLQAGQVIQAYAR